MLFRVFVIAWLLATCGFYELSELPDSRLMIAISAIMIFLIVIAWKTSRKSQTGSGSIYLSGSLTGIMISFSLGFIIGICYLYWHAFFSIKLPNDVFDRPVIIQAQISELPIWQEMSSLTQKNTRTSRQKLRLQMKLKQMVLFENSTDETKWIHVDQGLRVPEIQVNWYLSQHMKAEDFGLQHWPRLGETVWLSVKLKAPRGQSNPGAFDYDRYLFAKGIQAKGYVKGLTLNHWHRFQRDVADRGELIAFNPVNMNSSKNSVLAIADSNLFTRFYNSRTQLQTHLQNLFAGSMFFPVIEALTLGERATVSQEDWELFRKTGTIHLMAISGLHIGLAALFGWLFFWVFWKLIFYRFRVVDLWLFAKIGALLSATLYAFLSGFSISTERAWIMVIIGLLFLVWQRPFSVWNAFFVALWFVIFFQPSAVLMQGFWLSFLAVAWIFIFLPVLVNKSKWQQFLWIQLVLSLALVPALAHFFGAIPSFGFVANLIALPVISFIVMPLLFIVLIGLLVFPEHWHESFRPVVTLLDWVLKWLWQWLEWVSEWPNSLFEVPSIDGLWVLLIYGVAFYIAQSWVQSKQTIAQRFSHLSTKQRNSWRHYLTRLKHIENIEHIKKRCFVQNAVLWLVVCVGCVVVIIHYFMPNEKPKKQEALLTVLDVGQGLSVVVETKNKVLVYDLGAYWGEKMDGAKLAVLPYLNSRNIDSIDQLVISHSDNDHAGGLQTLLTQIAIGNALSGQPEKLGVNLANTVLSQCVAGQNWVWESIQFEIVAPLPEWLKRPNLSDNDFSCVLKISTGRSQVWLMGDLSTRYENQLLKALSEKDTAFQTTEMHSEMRRQALLVAGHHGSRYSSGEDWLSAVKPTFAIISAGYKNRYDFPHEEVLHRFESHSTRVLNTAYSGAIQFGIKPEGIELLNRNRIEQTKWYYHSSFSHTKIE